MDFEVQRCTRHCVKTDREFAPGEEFYSALIAQGAQIVRQDYCVEAWEGPPDGSLGSWKSKMPSPKSNRMHWAPNDIMLEYFEELADQPDSQDVRYVLALLMIRRRVVRLEETEKNAAGLEQLVLYCPRRDKTYHVEAVVPDENRTLQIQEELAQLLYADAA